MIQSVIFLDKDTCISVKKPNEAPVVIIEGSDCVLASLDFPRINASKFVKALPFILEEKLLADVKDLHFAVSPARADKTFLVGIIAKEKMHHYLQRLYAEGIFAPRIIVPLYLVLPHQQDTWHILIYKNIASVRLDKYKGFTTDLANLSVYLTAALKESTPKHILLHNFLNQRYALELGIKVEEIILPAENLPNYLVTSLNASPPLLNLLQRPFLPAHQTKTTKKIWTLTAACLGAAFMLILCNQIISFVFLKKALVATENSINQIYKHQFPHAMQVVSPRDRFAARLKEVSEGENQTLFLSLLSKVSPHINNRLVHIQHLAFHNNQLALTVSANSFADIDTLIQRLKQQGLYVKQENADLLGTQIHANLIITYGDV